MKESSDGGFSGGECVVEMLPTGFPDCPGPVQGPNQPISETRYELQHRKSLYWRAIGGGSRGGAAIYHLLAIKELLLNYEHFGGRREG